MARRGDDAGQSVGDVALEGKERVVRAGLGATEVVGQSNRAEGKRGVEFDDAARGEDDFEAAAAEIGDAGVEFGEVHARGGTAEGEESLFLFADDLDVKGEARGGGRVAHGAEELVGVAGLADGGGGEGSNHGAGVGAREGDEIADHPDGLRDGLGREKAGGREGPGEFGHGAIFGQDAALARGGEFDGDRADAGAPDVDDGDAERRGWKR